MFILTLRKTYYLFIFFIKLVNSRKKGDTFERKVKKYLISLGFLCYRNSASIFPDLIAIDKTGVIFIECKMNKYILKEEKQKFNELKKYGKCYIAYNVKGKINFCDIDYKPKNINISNVTKLVC